MFWSKHGFGSFHHNGNIFLARNQFTTHRRYFIFANFYASSRCFIQKLFLHYLLVHVSSLIHILQIVSRSWPDRVESWQNLDQDHGGFPQFGAKSFYRDILLKTFRKRVYKIYSFSDDFNSAWKQKTEVCETQPNPDV